MPTIYPPLSIGAKRRLEIFKKEAVDPKRHWIHPMTWRDVRFANLKSDTGLSQGSNGDTPVWYSHDGVELFKDRDADQIVNLQYTGWFTDNDQNDTAVGIVGKLPHGRYLAGYRWTSNDERVWFPEIYTDEADAARAADSHAESFAELSREEDAKYREAQELADENESALRRLKECITMRHVACMTYVRTEVPGLIKTIKENRERLRTEFAGYL